ncbi:hypothetical protein KDA23_00570, partial [Candidatus Saccharibacteria bacterium]|nr:hypothetical protein [Candidatus Saccharibacteria bacterium]
STHYIGRTSDTALRVRESQVQDLPLLSGAAFGDMIGLEVLCRVRASRKFCGRYQRGEIPKHKVLLSPGQFMQEGVKFKQPFVEFSTKWKLGGDDYLSDDAAATLTGQTAAEINEMIMLGDSVANIIDHFFWGIGFDVYDFKLEMARERGTGRLTVIDGLTLDEIVMYKDGQVYGKNSLRSYFEEHHSGWVELLNIAKKQHPEDKNEWPSYPPLPAKLKKSHVSQYQAVAANLSSRVEQLAA